MSEVSVQVPADVDEKEVKIILACELYSEGKLTLKQAADVAGLNIWDFVYELGKRKKSFTNIAPEDLEKELEAP